MNFLKQFDVKKVEIKPTRVKLYGEEIVYFTGAEEYKGKIKFTFESNDSELPYILLVEKDEDKIRDLFKMLMNPQYKEECKLEQEEYNNTIKLLESEFNVESASDEDKETITSQLNDAKSQVLSPVGHDKKFDDNFDKLGIDDLVGKPLRVVCIDKLKNSTPIRVIQTFAEVKKQCQVI